MSHSGDIGPQELEGTSYILSAARKQTEDTTWGWLITSGSKGVTRFSSEAPPPEDPTILIKNVTNWKTNVQDMLHANIII